MLAADARRLLNELQARRRRSSAKNLFNVLVLRRIFGGRHASIIEEAEKAKLPAVRVSYQEFTWNAARHPPEDPGAIACTEAVRAYVGLNSKQFDRAMQYWAAGDVQNMLQATPKGFAPLCDRLEPAYREYALSLQTHLLMEALRRPGKVVALYPTEHIVAADGVLARLEAEGYVIADPSQPLAED